MLKLNLPLYEFRIKKQNNKIFIFDDIRKKHVTLTPEEWVRQNFIRFLVEEKSFPKSYIAVEHEINVNGLRKRCDGLVYNRQMQPMVILEFKAPSVNITQETFDQAAVYNSKVGAKYFILSNGMMHICCLLNENAYVFLQEVPDFKSIEAL